MQYLSASISPRDTDLEAARGVQGKRSRVVGDLLKQLRHMRDGLRRSVERGDFLVIVRSKDGGDQNLGAVRENLGGVVNLLRRRSFRVKHDVKYDASIQRD